MEAQQNSSSKIVVALCTSGRSSQKWNRDTSNLRIKSLSGVNDRCITAFVDDLDGAHALRLDACGGGNAELQKFSHLGGEVANTAGTPDQIKYMGTDSRFQGKCWSAPNTLPGSTERRILLAPCAQNAVELTLTLLTRAWLWTDLGAV